MTCSYRQSRSTSTSNSTRDFFNFGPTYVAECHSFDSDKPRKMVSSSVAVLATAVLSQTALRDRLQQSLPDNSNSTIPCALGIELERLLRFPSYHGSWPASETFEFLPLTDQTPAAENHMIDGSTILRCKKKIFQSKSLHLNNRNLSLSLFACRPDRVNL